MSGVLSNTPKTSQNMHNDLLLQTDFGQWAYCVEVVNSSKLAFSDCALLPIFSDDVNLYKNNEGRLEIQNLLL